MDSLTIFEQDDPEILAFGVDVRPSSEPTVGLDFLANRFVNHHYNPFVPNAGAIGPLPSVAKVVCRLHLVLCHD